MNAKQRRRKRRALVGIGRGPTLAAFREEPIPAEQAGGFDEFLPAAPPRDAAWPEPLPPVLSPTSITTFLTCPEQWRRVYLVGETSRCSSALLVGRVDSKAREVDLGQKIESGVNLPLEAVQDAAASAWDAELEKEGGEREILWDQKDGPSVGAVKDLSIAVASAYRRQRAEWVAPIAVEERVEWTSDGVPFMIAGYVDVEEQERIREAKTSRKAQSKPSSGWLAQQAIYTAAKQLPVVFDVTVKKKAPEVLPEMHGYSVREANLKVEALAVSVADGILALLENVGPYRMWPGTAAVQMVSPCGWCDLRASCPLAVG